LNSNIQADQAIYSPGIKARFNTANTQARAVMTVVWQEKAYGNTLSILHVLQQCGVHVQSTSATHAMDAATNMLTGALVETVFIATV